MIDVTIANFEQEVIAASMSQPVLVDFWAPWCGPCKALGPILEKLETAYGGGFKLVKINSDEEQQLAGAFGIRSIPTVILLKNGQPVDGFMGALPEGQVREFLDKHVQALAEEEADEEPLLEEDPAAADPQAQLERLQHAVATDPGNDDARFDYVKALLAAGREADARRAFEPVANKASVSRRIDALARWLDAVSFARSHPNPADEDAKIAANRRDFQARYDRSRLLMAEGRWTAAMDELLEILMRDKAWNEDLARKTYIAILEIIEPPKPKVAEGQIPPDDPTVAAYRRRLSSVVLS
ncbi:thioredoxin [Ramlibacter ginsenosidimutans]|uniref:Thioredoxin n=1 Tax=Ramlibacter ginsenosidimutans TaxID=502333 RepID=A0A934TQW8_9BURK|nr:thioredoxin [Ramlibacter ginsenosidimutans]MBK6005813.1 thioredoxin [Ramlibacter ginsenosidimutans]